MSKKQALGKLLCVIGIHKYAGNIHYEPTSKAICMRCGFNPFIRKNIKKEESK